MPKPLVVQNGPCPSCGHPWQFVGEALPHGSYIFCCAAGILWHRDNMAKAGEGGVVYSADPELARFPAPSLRGAR